MKASNFGGVEVWRFGCAGLWGCGAWRRGESG